MNVTIIGGGVVGLCSAYYLQKQGYAVTVIEKNEITNGCSFGNMGYISPSHFVPLPTPGIISQGLKWMLNPSSPFYIKPRPSLALMQWGWHFWKSCNTKTIEKNAPHLSNLLNLSRQLITDIKNDIGNNFEMEEKGCLMLCKQQKVLEHEYELADEASKFNLTVKKLNREQVQQLETDVELDVAGAVLFKDDCHFNPGMFMQQLKNYLEQKGVNFLLNTTVTGFEKTAQQVTAVITNNQKINTQQLIIAAGSWLPTIANMLGIKLLLQAGKGYSYTYPSIEKNIKYPAILVDGRCAITPWGNKLRIGGTMELSGINSNIIPKRMEGIYNSVKNFYPSLQINLPPTEKIWSGLRPVTPDGLPYIGKHSSYSNVLFAGGHAMLGLSMASGTGKLATQIIEGKPTSIPIHQFKVERF